MTFQVGLTGGIASGKSTVDQLFVDLGAVLVDADLIAKQVVAVGTPGLAEIVQAMGPKVLDDDGSLDRAAMRKRIFSEPKLRAQLEHIVHPMVREEMARQIDQCDGPYCIVDVPLLAESRQHYRFDRIVVVDVTKEIQRARLKLRDGASDQTIDAMLAAQASRGQRLELADDVIDNNGCREDLPPQVAKLHELYLSAAQSKRNTL